jgi:hypothetical protein
MKKNVLTLAAIVLIVSCKKASDSGPVSITYEVESNTSNPFSIVTIAVPYYDSLTFDPFGFPERTHGTTGIRWTIKGLGTFDTTIQFRKNVKMPATMTASHLTSTSWKIRIKNNNSVLVEGSPKVFQSGGSTFYNASIQADIE